jgi:hypothetical protein
MRTGTKRLMGTLSILSKLKGIMMSCAAQDFFCRPNAGGFSISVPKKPLKNQLVCKIIGVQYQNHKENLIKIMATASKGVME